MRLNIEITIKFFVDITYKKNVFYSSIIFLYPQYLLTSIYSKSNTYTTYGSVPVKTNIYSTLKIDIGEQCQTENTPNKTHRWQEW